MRNCEILPIIVLLLPSTTFFDLQVYNSGRINVVIRQSVGILEENILHLQFLFASLHPGLIEQSGLQGRNGVGEGQGDRNGLAVQLPLGLVGHVGHYHAEGDGRDVPGQEVRFWHQIVLS
jgi:hypothetical protein